jgi:hypothetical protein
MHTWTCGAQEKQRAERGSRRCFSSIDYIFIKKTDLHIIWSIWMFCPISVALRGAKKVVQHTDLKAKKISANLLHFGATFA